MLIMLIDDDPMILKLLNMQLRNFNLEKFGFTGLVNCESCREALELLEQGIDRVGLIFCDLQMPEIDGVEMVRKLDERGFQGGLVLVSGESQRVLQAAELLARSHHLNVLGALQKPVAPDMLAQALSGLLQHFERRPPPTYAPYTVESLWRAIEDDQLVNHYQPQIACSDGGVRGVEALVRWRHPDDGLVPPDRFIALAETNGLIEALTRVVLNNALLDARGWSQQGIKLSLAVNVSMSNLTDLAFPDHVASAALVAGFPLDRLMLEVTESQVMSNLPASLDVLTRLRLKHAGLSIDDFGTGYSSLAQLRDLPFTELKIDRGFVHGAHSIQAHAAIVNASLDLARQLEISTVAEGVEDANDWAFVRASGCDVAQGYFFARPLPADQIPQWIRQWNGRRTPLTASASQAL